MSADRPPRSRTRKLSDAVGPYVVRSVERYAPEEVCFCLAACASSSTDGKSADRLLPRPAAADRARSQLCRVSGLFRSATSTASASETVRPRELLGRELRRRRRGRRRGRDGPGGGHPSCRGRVGCVGAPMGASGEEHGEAGGGESANGGSRHDPVLPLPRGAASHRPVRAPRCGDPCVGLRRHPAHAHARGLFARNVGLRRRVEKGFSGRRIEEKISRGKERGEDFLEGKRGGGAGAMESTAASPLRELEERWRSACQLPLHFGDPHRRPSEEILFGRDPARRGPPAGLGARG